MPTVLAGQTIETVWIWAEELKQSLGRKTAIFDFFQREAGYNTLKKQKLGKIVYYIMIIDVLCRQAVLYQPIERSVKFTRVVKWKTFTEPCINKIIYRKPWRLTKISHHCGMAGAVTIIEYSTINRTYYILVEQLDATLFAAQQPWTTSEGFSSLIVSCPWRPHSLIHLF